VPGQRTGLRIRQQVSVLTEYVKYFNQAGSHEGLALQISELRLSRAPAAAGNIIHVPTACASPGLRAAADVLAFAVLSGMHHMCGLAT